jgi:hypothetical protein
MNTTYSYECGADRIHRVVHRNGGEVIATVGPDSTEAELEVALKGWILSPDLRKIVEGWLKALRKPKTTKAATTKTPKAKKATTRSGPVNVTRL